MAILSLNQKKRQVELDAFELKNELVFSYFDKLPSSERDAQLLKAIHIGTVALMEDRISSFLFDVRIIRNSRLILHRSSPVQRIRFKQHSFCKGGFT